MKRACNSIPPLYFLLLVGAFFVSACSRGDEPVPPTDVEPVSTGKLVKKSLPFGNTTREWFAYIPTSYDGSRQVPLVISLHGGGGRGDLIADKNGWKEKAEQEGFIVVFPNGAKPNGPQGFNWNIFSWDTEPDDVGFLLTLMNRLSGTYRVDSSRVYMTGHSNGASMTNTFAFVHANKLAAIAPAQGAFMTSLNIDPYSNPQQPNAPIPVWIWRGEDENQTVPTASESRTMSDENQRQYWVRFNQANATPLTLTETDELFTYRTDVHSPGRAEVRFTVVLKQGHAYSPNYTNQIWDDFFVRHTRR